MRFFSKNKYFVILLLIFILGVFLRFYELPQRFLYTHDHDLQAWIVKDIIVNKHLRLIGQETSTSGVFIGPLYYYLLIPFYLIFKMDPIGTAVFSSLLGLFGVVSFYFIFSKTYGKKAGLIAAALYAVSYYTVRNDREVVPTMPVIIWTAWFFYAIHLFLSKKQKLGFLIAGVLAGLIWHINFALILLLPLIPLSIYFSKTKVKLKSLILGLTAFFLLASPFFVFEARHGFTQTKSVMASLSTTQKDVVSGVPKLERVVRLAAKNITNFTWGEISGLSHFASPILIFLAFIYLVKKRIIEKRIGIILTIWVLAYILFFSAYSKIVSEYYLNGILFPFIFVIAVFLASFLARKRTAHLSLFILFLFGALNVYRFFAEPINRSGYLERKAVIAEIKQDAARNGYPCIAISYIVDPGLDLGYRYFFYLAGMHVNRPSTKRPVYTIVYPLKPIFREDKTFGAIGLIYPDYKRYTRRGVEESCREENSNLTDPMFGYTQ